MKKCIAIICRQPQLSWLYFLNAFENYDIFFIIDDNQTDYNIMYKSLFPQINFIQIDEKVCQDAGFNNSSTALGFKTVIAWDKALYFFSQINKDYEHMWFIEDDVFFYNENTILTIDTNYPESDILSQSYEGGINIDGKRDDWHWSLIIPHIRDIKPPYYSTIICAVRMSKSLMMCINEYVTKNKSIFYIESFFSTIAKSNNLIYDNPLELRTIISSRRWDFDELNRVNLFHPIKNVVDHVNLRRLL
jgi:hypothetical protein